MNQEPPKTLCIPIKVISEANTRDHWRTKHRRKKKQRDAIVCWWWKEDVNVKLPIHVKLTRISPRRLDSDNLVSAFKHTRDVIADLITPGLAPGRADDLPGLTFSYEQRKGGSKKYEIEIELSKKGLT